MGSDPFKFFLSMYCKHTMLVLGLGQTGIHVRKSSIFLLSLDSIMTPELILVTDRTVIIQTKHWKIHCAPFLGYKTDLVFFKMGIELCNETQSCFVHVRMWCVMDSGAKTGLV